MPRGCVRDEPAFRLRPQVFAPSRNTPEAGRDDAMSVKDTRRFARRHRNLEGGARLGAPLQFRIGAQLTDCRPV
jgi:hypothetical protein